jgi:hypothetical protein
MTEGIPDWVFWLSTALGTGIGALIIRLGWKSVPQQVGSDKTQNDGQGYIDKVGVLVDPKTIELLSGSIEGSTLELIAVRKSFVEQQEQMVRVGHKLVDELDELRGDLRELARAVRQRGHQ